MSNLARLVMAILLASTGRELAAEPAASEPRSSATNGVAVSDAARSDGREAANSGSAAVTNLAGLDSDQVEQEYRKLLDADDVAQAEVDRWIRDNQAFAAKGGGAPASELNRRIEERFAPVRQGYEKFIEAHPTHSKVRIAYGSFLGDMGEEDASRAQYEMALELDPKNPAIHNNLANIYGHSGPVKKAFEHYEKALALNPNEPVYYHNFGTTVFLFRKDAKEHYSITEPEVFARAFGLYSNAMRLDPKNFPLASDVAQTYYGVNPLPTDQALRAWTNAFGLAQDDIEREGVHLHFARIKLLAGRYDEARDHLNLVTNEMYGELKGRITRNLNEKQETGK